MDILHLRSSYLTSLILNSWYINVFVNGRRSMGDPIRAIDPHSRRFGHQRNLSHALSRDLQYRRRVYSGKLGYNWREGGGCLEESRVCRSAGKRELTRVHFRSHLEIEMGDCVFLSMRRGVSSKKVVAVTRGSRVLQNIVETCTDRNKLTK